MTSSTNVEIGDDIWITDHQHPYYGKAGKAITVGEEMIGVRLNGSTSPVGIYVKVGGFSKITFHRDWHRKRADCQVQPILKDAPEVRPADVFTMTEPAVRTNPDYDLPFPVPKINPTAWLVDELEVQRIRYANPAGQSIYVEVPWGDHSGMIPPPYVTFFNEKHGELTFVCDPQ